MKPLHFMYQTFCYIKPHQPSVKNGNTDNKGIAATLRCGAVFVLGAIS